MNFTWKYTQANKIVIKKYNRKDYSKEHPEKKVWNLVVPSKIEGCSAVASNGGGKNSTVLKLQTKEKYMIFRETQKLNLKEKLEI